MNDITDMEMEVAMDNMVRVAKEAGVPAGQVERFLGYGYVPLQWQWKYHAACRLADMESGPTAVACGGARGPGKSHAMISQIVLDDCIRAPGIKVLFLRNTGKAARESFTDLIDKALKGRIAYTHSRHEGVLYLQNGARVLLGGYHTEGDVDTYIGIEYDLIAIEEATQITEGKINRLLGSLRTSRQDWRPRLYLSSNPGGIGHLGFKRSYVIPYRTGSETTTRFIPATYRDNPFLNKEYITYLEGLTGDLGRAWRDGDWDVFEGQAFPLWREDLHVVPDFEIPSHWTKIMGVDWGYSAPWAVLWGAKDPDTGRVYIYRELNQTNLTDIQQARAIKDHTGNEMIRARYADPSMWTKRTIDDYARSTADVYAAEGVMLTKANNDRLDGKRRVDRMLGMMPDGKPGLQVFESCRNLREHLPALPYDKFKPEDVDTGAIDHDYDALRYLLTDSDAQPRRQKKVIQINPLEKVRNI